MYPIVFSTDKVFCPHAAALIRSIHVNCHNDQYELHILSDNLDFRSKEGLRSCTDLSVTFHDIDAKFIKDHPLPKKITFLPRAAYFRLYIPEILSDYDRVLYIDVDTLVLSDVEELFHIPMEDSLSLACLDYGITEKHLAIYERFIKDKNAPYFNSGVMVIDVPGWKANKVKQNSYDLLENEMKDPVYADQEVLNVVLENKWKQIDRKWNYPPHVSDYNAMPKILHFMGYKPIYTDYRDRHKDTFYHYLKGTPWEGVEYGLIKKALIKGPYRIKTFLTKLYLKLKK
jgi:lipopolysaccharide biosynthesis glycosyltransferase